jgi:hypothetical protein
MAQRVSIVCGDTILDLHSAKILANPRRYSPKISEWFLRYSRKDSPKTHRAEELLDLLNLTSHSSASDTRDQVFVVLGLVSGSKIDRLVPDYALSLGQVHTGIAA